MLYVHVHVHYIYMFTDPSLSLYTQLFQVQQISLYSDNIVMYKHVHCDLHCIYELILLPVLGTTPTFVMRLVSSKTSM